VVRLTITLDDESARKLAKLAERTRAQPDAIARSLLCTALDEVDADPRTVPDLLDGIPGALERARLGQAQADAGETLGTEELRSHRGFG
jgi:hypothetical protein